MGKARRDGNDTGGISSIVIPRPFEEVLMECKDAKGVQKFIAVPSTMQWNELLQVALLVQKYLLASTKVQILTQLCCCRPRRAQFTCFTSTKVQILTAEEVQGSES